MNLCEFNLDYLTGGNLFTWDSNWGVQSSGILYGNKMKDQKYERKLEISEPKAQKHKQPDRAQFQNCRSRNLTPRQWGWNLVNITVFRIQNQKLPIWRRRNWIWFNSKFRSIEYRLHRIATLKFHHGTIRNRWKIKSHKLINLKSPYLFIINANINITRDDSLHPW